MLFKKKIEANSIITSLVDAEHVSASHKLEVNEQFYLFGNKIVIKEITDKSGEKVKVLCVE